MARHCGAFGTTRAIRPLRQSTKKSSGEQELSGHDNCSQRAQLVKQFSINPFFDSFDFTEAFGGSSS